MIQQQQKRIESSSSSFAYCEMYDLVKKNHELHTSTNNDES